MKFKAGDLVYMNYTPAVCGRVVLVVAGEKYPRLPHHRAGVDYGNRPDMVYVRLLRPAKSLRGVRSLVKEGETLYRAEEFLWNDFRKLAEDTRRKADRHEATLRALERIPAPGGTT